MKVSPLSRFTPSLMDHETLEKIFVQREDLAARIVDLIHESSLTQAKHHTLLIGPRGIGKTHLVSLVYHRLCAIEALRENLVIAWLREEEWGVTSFLELLLRILRALQATPDSRALSESMETIYKVTPTAAEREAVDMLSKLVGDRTLLIVMENMDDLFKGLGSEGQKRMRAFLQERAFCSILATAQSLFNGVSHRTSPFYGFFRIQHLEDLVLEDAVTLLSKIAHYRGNEDLASFLESSRGRARVRAIHHLAGGNHRIYVILSEFLTKQSLDDLVEPFMAILDDMTPYYQARLQWLSQQQRKIVEFLCDRRGAVPVKEIAMRCFMSHQTASGQLKTLREMGYVRSEPLGREAYYELHEPLMQMCIEVKKHRGKPLRLLVDFIRVWYSRPELREWITRLTTEDGVEHDYLSSALQIAEADSHDTLVSSCIRDYKTARESRDVEGALRIAEELIEIRGSAADWAKKGDCLADIHRFEAALEAYNRSSQLDPKNATVWTSRAFALIELDRCEEALEGTAQAISLTPGDPFAWMERGEAFRRLERSEEALSAFDEAVRIAPKNTDAWHRRGHVLFEMSRLEDALKSFERMVALDPQSVHGMCMCGLCLGGLDRYQEGLKWFEEAIRVGPTSAEAWSLHGAALHWLNRHEESLVSQEKATSLDPSYVQAWLGSAGALVHLGRPAEALKKNDRAMDLAPREVSVWDQRALILVDLKRGEESLSALTRALEFGDRPDHLLQQRAEVLMALGRWEDGWSSLAEGLTLAGESNRSELVNGRALVRLLFLGDPVKWSARVKGLLAVCKDHGVLPTLGAALLAQLVEVIGDRGRGDLSQEWLTTWKDVAGEVPELELPMRLLETIISYLQGSDRRILLELPAAERDLAESIINSLPALPRAGRDPQS